MNAAGPADMRETAFYHSLPVLKVALVATALATAGSSRMMSTPTVVTGPGGGLEKISASGPVYKLASVSDFAGRYTQSTGKAGLSTSGGSDLWLENSAGVIMHMEGSSTGAMLTLGKDEIFVRMAQ
jgi:hypothetical protein